MLLYIPKQHTHLTYAVACCGLASRYHIRLYLLNRWDQGNRRCWFLSRRGQHWHSERWPDKWSATRGQRSKDQLWKDADTCGQLAYLFYAIQWGIFGWER